MTSTNDERSCAPFHLQQRLLRSPFAAPRFIGGPGDRYVTAAIQHCSFRGDDGPALLRLTLHTPEGNPYIDLPTYTAEDLSRRLRGLTTVAEDLDGLEGYHAAQYKDTTDDCTC